MCLITFAYKKHKKYKLIIVANRDEFYQRPTATANWWNDEPTILAGRDLKGNGTWMGFNKNGRFSALTNYRNGFNEKKNAPSRGDLVTSFLLSQNDSLEYLQQLTESADSYNGYNLLTFDGKNLAYYSNQIEQPTILESGIYGLSNSTLDIGWPKVNKATSGLKTLLQQENFQIDDAFTIMQNRAIASDNALPNTNIPMKWERLLSSMYIESPEYGTRCSTVFLLDYDGNYHFEERSYVPNHQVIYKGPV
ncbi:MAG: NRDE family protein [Saprospiraceae bacterium]